MDLRNCSHHGDRGWGKFSIEDRGWGKSNIEDRGWGKSNIEDRGWGKSNIEDRGWRKSNIEDRGWGKSNNEDRGWAKSNISYDHNLNFFCDRKVGQMASRHFSSDARWMFYHITHRLTTGQWFSLTVFSVLCDYWSISYCRLFRIIGLLVIVDYFGL